MIRNISNNSFHDAFLDMGREEQFSYAGKNALMSYLESLEEDCDMTIELDVIALCCEFTEYDDLEELQKDYPEIESLEDLYNRTQVIEFNYSSLIIGAF